jgi:hypothetical protein
LISYPQSGGGQHGGNKYNNNNNGGTADELMLVRCTDSMLTEEALAHVNAATAAATLAADEARVLATASMKAAEEKRAAAEAVRHRMLGAVPAMCATGASVSGAESPRLGEHEQRVRV